MCGRRIKFTGEIRNWLDQSLDYLERIHRMWPVLVHHKQPWRLVHITRKLLVNEPQLLLVLHNRTTLIRVRHLFISTRKYKENWFGETNQLASVLYAFFFLHRKLAIESKIGTIFYLVKFRARRKMKIAISYTFNSNFLALLSSIHLHKTRNIQLHEALEKKKSTSFKLRCYACVYCICKRDPCDQWMFM